MGSKKKMDYLYYLMASMVVRSYIDQKSCWDWVQIRWMTNNLWLIWTQKKIFSDPKNKSITGQSEVNSVSHIFTRIMFQLNFRLFYRLLFRYSSWYTENSDRASETMVKLVHELVWTSLCCGPCVPNRYTTSYWFSFESQPDYQSNSVMSRIIECSTENFRKHV